MITYVSSKHFFLTFNEQMKRRSMFEVFKGVSKRCFLLSLYIGLPACSHIKHTSETSRRRLLFPVGKIKTGYLLTTYFDTVMMTRYFVPGTLIPGNNDGFTFRIFCSGRMWRVMFISII